MFELLRSQIGKLQRGRGECDKAIGVLLTPGSEAFILHLDDFGGEVAIGGVPPVAIDAERLNVNSTLIHFREAIRS